MGPPRIWTQRGLPTIARTISCSIPSLLYGVWVLSSFRDEYYWPTYVIMTLSFFLTSLILGLFLPILLQDSKFNYPWLWVFIAGGLAWLVALAVFALLNLTPLCIGQDNGDGNNDIALCIMYTVLISLVYSPVALILVTLNAIFYGKNLNRVKNTIDQN